jgi:hypothetical protein
MRLGDLVCHRKRTTRNANGIGIVINENPEKDLHDIVSVYWFKLGKEQQIWKQVLKYVR